MESMLQSSCRGLKVRIDERTFSVAKLNFSGHQIECLSSLTARLGLQKRMVKGLDLRTSLKFDWDV